MNKILKIFRLLFNFKYLTYILSKKYINYYENYYHNIFKNGEFNLIKKFKFFERLIIFDVGANTGKYTECCLDNLKVKEIHLFEISDKSNL